MRIFKKSMAIFLGALIVAGASAFERLFVSAEAPSKKEVELLDLSDYDAGTALIKGTTPLPYNMNWGKNDDYEGKREVVCDPDTKKNVLKLNFDKKETVGSRELGNIKNYEFVLDIPEAYRPYLYSVKMEIDNQTVKWSNWSTKSLYYWLSFTDGKNYAINGDNPNPVYDLGNKTYESVITDMRKVDENNYLHWCEDWKSRTQWSEADKTLIKKVCIPFTVPSESTGYCVIVKSVKIVLNCTDEQFKVAQNAAQKAASAIIDDYESGYESSYETGKIVDDYCKTNNDGNEILKDAAHGGKYALRHTRPSDMYSGSVIVTLDNRSVKSDGISFYVNNSKRQGTTAPSLRCFIVAGKVKDKDNNLVDNIVAQKILKISKQRGYFKYTVFFDDLGRFDGDKTWGGTNDGIKLTKEDKAEITQLEIRFSETSKDDTFDFDDFCYEKKPVQSNDSYVNTASDNSYQTGTRAFGAIFTEIANATDVKTGFVIWTEKLFKSSQKTELDLSCVDSSDNASALDISYSGQRQPEKLYGILLNNKNGGSVTEAYAKTVFVARPYITYTDAGGNVQTVYGDMITSNATKQ